MIKIKIIKLCKQIQAINTFKRTIEIDQKYYPERLQHFFMINTPL